jgi:tetratricopeptide (TPR) repeat protein
MTQKMLNEELAALSALVINEPQKALALLREYDEKYGKDPNFLFNSGGFLIDIGDGLGQSNFVLEGIGRIEVVLDQVGHDHPNMFYNVANGYSTLCNLVRRSQGKGYQLDPDETPLLRAKYYYRRALEKIDQISQDLRAQLWMNYGNCLSGLGRAVEAMSAYDKALRIVPDHPMAKGNLAIELHYFSKIAQSPLFLLDALEMLEQVLSKKNFRDYAGVGARQAFAHTRDQIVAEISKLGIDEVARAEQKPTNVPSGYVGEYVEFCAGHHLSLNFCLSCRRCDRYVEDSLAFSLITDLDDRTSFTRLARVINEIKESYAFARLLLFQAISPPLNTIPIDDLTAYVDNLDYAVYGVRIASLKLAFESAYNILDKIAHFLNDYLKLGVRSGPRLTFTTNGTIWRKKNNNLLRPELMDLNNQHLLGLYDLARDLDIDHKQPENDGYWGQLRHTRNSLTHEYLIPHIEGIGWAVEADNESLHFFYTDFVHQTIDLLQLVRAAVIYLIAFIDLKERRKSQASEGLDAPLYVTWYKPTLFTPGLDLWGPRNPRLP